ncbi:hypothetical protein B0H13DRAFT_1895326 [Mycena leptocephala]|nr:hypothetical protein B0H13DRAFT_1895326 [Mycena leptocephala]
MNNNNNSMRRFIRVDPARVETVISTRMPGISSFPATTQAKLSSVTACVRTPPLSCTTSTAPTQRRRSGPLQSARYHASFAPLPVTTRAISSFATACVSAQHRRLHHNADGVASPIHSLPREFRPLPGHNAREIVVRDRMRGAPPPFPPTVSSSRPQRGRDRPPDNNLDEDPQQVLGKMIVLTLLFVVERRLKAPGVVVDDGPGIWDLVILAFLVAYFVRSTLGEVKRAFEFEPDPPSRTCPTERSTLGEEEEKSDIVA